VAPSYSGGSDQEDHGSKPAHTNRPWDPISKKPLQKWAAGIPQDVALSSSPKMEKRKKSKDRGDL
jgi:hypothetical protein